MINISCSRAQTMRRWLTFRNILILVTNIIFLIALILRSHTLLSTQCWQIFCSLIFADLYLRRFLAHQNNQCRDGDCPYEENKMAFIGVKLSFNLLDHTCFVLSYIFTNRAGGCLWAVGALLTFLRSIQVSLPPISSSPKSPMHPVTDIFLASSV